MRSFPKVVIIERDSDQLCVISKPHFKNCEDFIPLFVPVPASTTVLRPRMYTLTNDFPLARIEKVLQTFSCQDFPEIDKSYLRADLRLECYTPLHRKYMIYAGFMVVVCE